MTMQRELIDEYEVKNTDKEKDHGPQKGAKQIMLV
jgi:hypothetical protein